MSLPTAGVAVSTGAQRDNREEEQRRALGFDQRQPGLRPQSDASANPSAQSPAMIVSSGADHGIGGERSQHTKSSRMSDPTPATGTSSAFMSASESRDDGSCRTPLMARKAMAATFGAYPHSSFVISMRFAIG